MSQRVLGIEIGGTKLQAALGTTGGDILSTRRGVAPSDQGALAILEWFGGAIPELVAEARSQGDTVTRMGVGFGGPVESATGKVLTSHQVEGWKDFELKPWFESRFGIETRVFNDSNAAGWGEYRLGAGRGTSNFMYSNIGSGIGGALVIEGKLLDGQGRGAGELGHTYVPDEYGAPGATDKLEHLCSGWAIERRMRARTDIDTASPLGKLCGGNPATITCAMVGQAARAGDPIAQGELDRVGRTIGLALANAVTLFHPERIAMGGGVSLIGDVLLNPIRRSANHHTFGPFQDRFTIVPCELAESVVLAGAILLAAEPAI